MNVGCAIFFIIVALVVFGIMRGFSSTSSTSSPSPSSSLSSSSNTNTSETSHTWSYSEEPDKLGRGTVRTASIESTNTVEFGFPYSGVQRATLQLRKHPEYGKDVILYIEKGQFLCRFDGCSVNIRFGDGTASKYSAAEAGDNSTTVLFIQNYDRFVGNLMKANKVAIEATFYQEGARVFEFDVSNLTWKP